MKNKIGNFESAKENKIFKYQMVSNGIMNKQINLRLSEQMLKSAKNYAKNNGFNNVQEFIKDTLREKLFEKPISNKELALVKKLIQASEKNKLYSTEKELIQKLRSK